MLIWIGDGKVQIFCIIFFPDMRYSSRLMILQHSFTCLHLRNMQRLLYKHGLGASMPPKSLDGDPIIDENLTVKP
jgi:hypothetical protein